MGRWAGTRQYSGHWLSDHDRHYSGFWFADFNRNPQSFASLFEGSIRHLPLVSLIYFSVKDLISAFVGDKKKFNQPVLVLMNRESGIRKIGFITQTDLSNLGLDDAVMVYCPHSYAFSGELYLVPAENVKLLTMSSSEAMKLIVSGGVSK